VRWYQWGATSLDGSCLPIHKSFWMISMILSKVLLLWYMAVTALPICRLFV